VSIDRARHWLDKIHQLPVPAQPFNLLNVCGGHERSITHAGLRSVLPEWLTLIPGPGCPVCVCPEADIALAISIALREHVILVAFGDMLRVPINTATLGNVIPKAVRSMAQAKATGADIRPIASPMEARKIAQENPDRRVVFFAAGFETTMAPVAALMSEYFRGSLPQNLLFLISGRRTWPAVELLLNDPQSTPIAGMIAPGHVATVMGAAEWEFVVRDFHLPTAIAGFESESLLHGFYCVVQQALAQRATLDNCYAEAVSDEGNKVAQSVLDKCFSITSATWRGIGDIPQSGYSLKPSLEPIDARAQYQAHIDAILNTLTLDNMPKSCHCADVVMARKTPSECSLYRRSCTPRQPIGPCMVSDEGACRIWWSAGK